MPSQLARAWLATVLQVGDLRRRKLWHHTHRLWVKRDVEKIFDYRRERIAERFGEARTA